MGNFLTNSEKNIYDDPYEILDEDQKSYKKALLDQKRKSEKINKEKRAKEMMEWLEKQYLLSNENQ